MRILQFVPTLGSGGAEHFVYELSNGLVNQGHTVEILTLYDTPSDNPIRLQLDPRIRLTSLKKRKGFEPRILYSVIPFIHRHKFDVVHGHVGAIKYMLFAAFLKRKVKYFATIHSEAKREAGKSLDKWSRLMMFKCRVCTPVTISPESYQSFQKYYHLEAPLILNGVAPYKEQQRLSLKRNKNQIVFIHPASCQPVKNQELLLLAFAKLAEEYPNIRLIWIGSNTYYPALFAKLEKLMIRQVDYLGVVPNVRDYLNVADAMCLSSTMEGLPMVVLESFSVGCVPLCTPVGGCCDVIQNGVNGFLSDDISIYSYYKMMRNFVELSKEKRQSLSRESYNSYASYTIDNTTKAYINLYQSH